MTDFFAKRYEIAVMGDKGVGKTSFVNRYGKDVYNSYGHYSSINNYFCGKRLFCDPVTHDLKYYCNKNDCETCSNDHLVILRDININEINKEQQIKNLSGVIIVADLTNINSVEAVTTHLEEFHRHNDQVRVCYLIINKTDMSENLKGSSKVAIDECLTKLDDTIRTKYDHSIKIYSTSLKDNKYYDCFNNVALDNINCIIEQLCKDIKMYESIQEETSHKSGNHVTTEMSAEVMTTKNDTNIIAHFATIRDEEIKELKKKEEQIKAKETTVGDIACYIAFEMLKVYQIGTYTYYCKTHNLTDINVITEVIDILKGKSYKCEHQNNTIIITWS